MSPSEYLARSSSAATRALTSAMGTRGGAAGAGGGVALAGGGVAGFAGTRAEASPPRPPSTRLFVIPAGLDHSARARARARARVVLRLLVPAQGAHFMETCPAWPGPPRRRRRGLGRLRGRRGSLRGRLCGRLRGVRLDGRRHAEPGPEQPPRFRALTRTRWRSSRTYPPSSKARPCPSWAPLGQPRLPRGRPRGTERQAAGDALRAGRAHRVDLQAGRLFPFREFVHRRGGRLAPLGGRGLSAGGASPGGLHVGFSFSVRHRAGRETRGYARIRESRIPTN